MGKTVQQGALIDTGCTRCLMKQSLAEILGPCIMYLQTPITFKQMNDSVLGGQPSIRVTELVHLEIGQHWELICFVVVETMIEPLILGLSWLDKWEPIIWWEGVTARYGL